MSPRFLSVGEILFDVFPDRQILGGAPANFACIAHRLGAASSLISRIGDDARGRNVRRELAKIGFPADGVTTDPTLPTGVVTVTLSDGQPSYIIETDAAWDHIIADATAMRLAMDCDVICFGTLAQRAEPSRTAIREIVAATPPTTLRILDVNLRKPFVYKAVIERSLALANVLKLNHDELPLLAEVFGLRSDNTIDRLCELAERFELRLVALTRGDAGSVLYAAGHSDENPGTKVEVVDTVGAGDAFTAAAAMAFLRGRSLPEINRIANQIAAYVCTQPGATPPIPTELRTMFDG